MIIINKSSDAILNNEKQLNTDILKPFGVDQEEGIFLDLHHAQMQVGLHQSVDVFTQVFVGLHYRYLSP